MNAILKRADHRDNVGKRVRIVGETRGGALIVEPIDPLVGVDPAHPIYAYDGDLELLP